MKKLKNSKFSQEHINYLKKINRKKIIVFSTQIIILVAFFGLWELFAVLGVIDSFIMSSPSRIIRTVGDLFQNGNLTYHIFVTLYEAVLGFVLATVIGFVIAVLLWWSEYLRKILEPYLVVINSLPKIALGPIIIVWFGAGTKSIIVMAFLIMIIITIMSFLSAFVACDEDKILLLKSMNASKMQIFLKLVLPNALPEFISILKINVGMTWVGTIMGEYLVSRAGLGYLIVYGGQVFKLDLVMSSTVILCLLASLMYSFVALLEKKIKS